MMYPNWEVFWCFTQWICFLGAFVIPISLVIIFIFAATVLQDAIEMQMGRETGK